MASYIAYKNRKYSLPSDCSFSAGNSCNTKERRMSDGSGTSYAITTYVAAQQNTYSLSFILTSLEFDLIDELYKFEDLVGKAVDLNYCDLPFKNVIINDLSVSFGLDATNGLTSLQLTLNMQDNVGKSIKTRKAEKIIVNTKLV